MSEPLQLLPRYNHFTGPLASTYTLLALARRLSFTRETAYIFMTRASRVRTRAGARYLFLRLLSFSFPPFCAPSRELAARAGKSRELASSIPETRRAFRRTRESEKRDAHERARERELSVSSSCVVCAQRVSGAAGGCNPGLFIRRKQNEGSG